MGNLTKSQIRFQRKFHMSVKVKAMEKGIRMSELYERAQISAPHWSFIGKGTRPLTADLKARILRALNHKNGNGNGKL